MPGANVGCEIREPDGRVISAWSAHNIAMDQYRLLLLPHLFDLYLVDAPFGNYVHFGTGTTVPFATALQIGIFVTSKATAAASGIGASALTGRLYVSLGPTEMTGLITEIGVANAAGPGNVNLFAWAQINGGTGITHTSGTQAAFTWDFVLGTGEQPF